MTQDEMERRLETIDARLEGINHHTKIASQYMMALVFLVGFAVVVSLF